MARALRLARARRKDAGESRVQAVSAGRVDIVSCFTTVRCGFAFQAVNDKWVTLLHVIPASFIRRDDVNLHKWASALLYAVMENSMPAPQ
jgi:hypothetical protein